MAVSKLLLSLVFPVVVSHAWAAARPVVLPIKAEEIRDQLASKGLCAEVSAAALCRHFPWPARVDEGVLSMGNVGVIMLREEPEGGNELAGFISKFPESQKLEMYALFALSGESMTKAINTSPFTSFLVLLMDKNTPGKTRAALFTSRGAVTNFGASTAREWRLEVGAASAWTPPVEFNPFYEFQVF